MTDPTPQDDTAPEENEVMRETRRAREQADAAEAAQKAKKQIGWKTGVGIGVGSAALLAALMYANRKK
ncbi:MAG: hypothetical protein SFV20_01330 [Sphingopyxis sp.]|nr:hypothetical protein [Sphingopyxis sp.]